MITHLLSDMQSKDRQILDLKCRLEALKRQIFGRKSEKVDPNQLALFEDLSRQLAAAEATPAEPDEAKPSASSSKSNGHARRPLPADMPTEEIVQEPEEQDRTCSTCRTPMARIGEEVTQELEYVPASFILRRLIRPKYACKSCQDGVVIADLPPRPIPKGIPGPGLLAQVLTSKYCDHLPLHRQQQIFRRHGVDLADSTLCDWVRDMADLLCPIVVEMKKLLATAWLVNTDDTPVQVVDRGDRPCGKGYLYTYILNGKLVIFDFAENHSRAGPVNMLGQYKGCVQADAHSSYNALFAPGEDGTCPRVEVGCWAHARRKFYDSRLDDRRRCGEMLALVGQLYDVEREAKELQADARRAIRQERSRPVLDTIRERLERWSIEMLPASSVGQAVSYARGQWAALMRYLEDGRLPIDNNISERTLRMAAIGRKNWLFFGSDAGGHRAAVIYSLVATCKLAGLDPFAYLRDAIAQAADPRFTSFASLVPGNRPPQA
jgi:transposase